MLWRNKSLYKNVMEENNEDGTPKSQQRQFSSVERQKEYELADKLGLERQKKIIEIEDKGYKVVHEGEVGRLFQVIRKNDEIKWRSLNEFPWKIPLNIMHKIDELKKNNLFTDIYIVYPSTQTVAIVLGKIYYTNGTDLYFSIAKWGEEEYDGRAI